MMGLTRASPDLHLFRLDPHLFELSLLYSGEKAFADTAQFFLADVPQKYQGAKMIRGLSDPSIEDFAFSVNMAVNVYVASPINEPLPLEPFNHQPWTPHDTQEELSIYRGTNPLSVAVGSSRMKIREIMFTEGGLLSFRVADKGIPFLLFLEKRKESAVSCGGKAKFPALQRSGRKPLAFLSGGEQQVLSLVGGPAFASCEASSEQSEEFGCQAGLNGRHMDARNGVWRTASGNGKGACVGKY